jgi:selenocysteine-specific elongation factor
MLVCCASVGMPPTREHLDIRRLLGLRHGVIALAKCDLVDDTTRGVVAVEVRDSPAPGALHLEVNFRS